MDNVAVEGKDLNQQAVALIAAGNFDAAREKLEQAIDLDPMIMESYKNYGNLYMSMNNYSEAKNYYKKALLIEKSGQLYFLYGNACFLNDEPHEGLENYNLALTAGFDNEEMLFFMGMAYEHLNDDQMALRYFQKAILKNPSRPDFKIKRITVLLRLDMMDEAEKAVDQLLIDSPEMFDGYHIKNAILMSQKRWDEAEKFAKSAYDRFPEDPDLYYDYVNIVAQKGEIDKAVLMIDKAKKLKYYEEAMGMYALLGARLYAEQGNMEQAIASCRESISLEKEGEFNGEARFLLINMYIVQNDYKNALDTALEIIAKDNQDSFYYAALYYKPFCLKKLGNDDEAADSYMEAISIYRLATLKNAQAIEAYIYRAMCLKDMEKYDEALELLEFIEGLRLDIAEVYTIRADVYKLTGKEQLMREELEKAYKLKPELRAGFEEGGE